jgi:hypothetical protein
MGQNYSLVAVIHNPSPWPISLTLDTTEQPTSDVQGSESSQIVTVAPGIPGIFTLGTFNHTWSWLPATPQPITDEGSIFAAMLPKISSALTAKLGELVGDALNVKSAATKSAFSLIADAAIAALDINNIYNSATYTKTINYSVVARNSDGQGIFADTVPVTVEVSQAAQDDLTEYVVLFVLADEVETLNPALNAVLKKFLSGMAQDEYRLALRG